MTGIENAAPPPPPIYERRYEGSVKFTSRAELVLVPVVVKDKSGNFVTGLTVDDFTVTENGQPQKVSTFEEVKPSASPVERPRLAPMEYTNVVTGGSSPRRMTIIALDLVNTPFLDQARAREQLLKYLAEQVDANNLTALVTIHIKGITVIQDFTGDPKALVAGLQTVKGKLHLTEATSLSSPRTDEIIAQAAGDVGVAHGIRLARRLRLLPARGRRRNDSGGLPAHRAGLRWSAGPEVLAVGHGKLPLHH
ncbi:MAG TPA: VWA domain-containing protein [Terriglobales bacterium]|nr:VWA domain-containing protein [Terriglobales bacterium]